VVQQVQRHGHQQALADAHRRSYIQGWSGTVSVAQAWAVGAVLLCVLPSTCSRRRVCANMIEES